jgi:hypothetical protein
MRVSMLGSSSHKQPCSLHCLSIAVLEMISKLRDLTNSVTISVGQEELDPAVLAEYLL